MDIADDLKDVALRVPKKLELQISKLAAACGLTTDQMASAIFILSQQGFFAEPAPDKNE